jgi:transcription-repair coupling factor (superfamily II helicase)
VYIRRDINAYQEAWIFDATTEEYLGKANAMQSASFLANSDIQKAHYQKIIETKNKEKKILKSYIQTKFNPSNEELVDNLIESLDKKDFKSNVKVAKISNTKMDKVIKEEKSKNNAPAKYVTPLQPKKKLYLTEAEKRRDIAKKAI